MEYCEALLIVLLICSLTLYYLKSRRWNKSLKPTNWPLFGMLPGLLQNAYRVHDFVTDVLNENGGTFMLKGPWFTKLDMLLTSDPANVHHVLSKNFSNYPKGLEFRELFEILGDGIFNADYQVWEVHRKTTMALMNHADFHQLLEKVIWSKVEKGLVPVLDYFCKLGGEFDLQDVFQRFTFDSISQLLLDYDPQSLSIDLPYIPCEKAFPDVAEAMLYRHLMPHGVWKFMKWLQIGKEGKLIKAWKVFDEFIYSSISLKQQGFCDIENKHTSGDSQPGKEYNLLAGFLKAFDGFCVPPGDSRKFLRDTFFNLIFAGRDTTSTALAWLFWLLDKNPSAKAKIIEEIEAQLHIKQHRIWRSFDVEESRKLVYLHGALCESLRLYPPVSFEHKASEQSDVLPSGHHIDPNSRMVISFYSMGRMETIWGNDCLEFKPERWISERGGIKHEPSFKFPAFNAGPRTCIGRDMAFIQMKMVAATIIYNYNFQVVDGHPVFPSPSVIIQMKNGLKVRLSRRNV